MLRLDDKNMSPLPKSQPDRISEVCPYSDPPFGEFTDDHVFPDFLGGRRTIRVCRDCNSRFGHSFEAKAASQLKQLQVFISHFGLDLSKTPGIWPSAEIDGTRYNLLSGPDGVQYELARPVIRRDESGKIIGGQARSRSEAEQFAASLLKKGKAKEVTIEEAPRKTLEGITLTADMSYNDDLYRFSAKLVSNTAVAMGHEAFIKQSHVAHYLHGSTGWGVCAAYSDTSAIRKLRPPLSHTVYLEFGPLQSHAVVILFGGWQIYVPLPPAERDAVLSYLDPITGTEFFGRTKVLNMTPSPRSLTEAEWGVHVAYVNKRLEEEANSRGAKHPPKLTISSYDFGTARTK
jgi:hypothetical protein